MVAKMINIIDKHIMKRASEFQIFYFSTTVDMGLAGMPALVVLPLLHTKNFNMR
jgi:hypothetical protein